jgi:hypothetical protein
MGTTKQDAPTRQTIEHLLCAPKGEEWPPHSGQSRRTTGGEKGDEGARHHDGVQRSLSIASVVAGDLSDSGGVGGEGVGGERKARSNGIGHGRWKVGNHTGFRSV